jgi:hypothetical protein
MVPDLTITRFLPNTGSPDGLRAWEIIQIIGRTRISLVETARNPIEAREQFRAHMGQTTPQDCIRGRA